MVKHFKNLLSRNHYLTDFGETVCTKRQRPKSLIFCSHYDPGLTLTFFYGKVKFCNLGFYMGKYDNDGFFGEKIAYCDLKFGYYILNE